MQTLKILGFLATIGLIASGTACKKKSPSPQEECIEGVIVAEAYREHLYTGVLYACETVVQIKNRNIGGKWGNLDNCVVIKNLDPNWVKLNQRLYFDSYVIDEQCGPWKTDCTPCQFCIIVNNLSINQCTKNY